MTNVLRVVLAHIATTNKDITVDEKTLYIVGDKNLINTSTKTKEETRKNDMSNENTMNVVRKYINKCASDAEHEVERLLKDMLWGTPFAGKVKAVGGYVRDQYLSLIKKDPSIKPKDLDIVVDMPGGAEAITKYLHNKLVSSDGTKPVSEPRQMGKSYPIWQIVFKSDVEMDGKNYATNGAEIEFVDPMKESYPDSDSRQRTVQPGTIEEDIERRDFTVNMLLKDLTTGEIEDLTGVGKSDIEQGILRGHPKVELDKMFSDDPLRMMRLIRFHVKYGWQVPRFVIRAVQRNSERINIVSAERITGELEKVMKLGRLDKAVRLMSLTGLLKHIMPEVEQMKGVAQTPRYHSEGDVFKHTMLVLRNTPPGVESQMAALLHDVGKPATSEKVGDDIKTYGHDEVGAEIAEAILKRLKFDNDTTNRIKSMVRYHMQPHFMSSREDFSVKGLRRFIRKVGDGMVNAILTLARADELGAIPNKEKIPDLIKRIEDVRKSSPISNKSVLDGHEVMQLLNITTGPEVGKANKILTEISDDYAEDGKELTKENAKRELTKRFFSIN